MVQKKKKKARHFWRDALIVAGVLFALNLYLTTRLERYLRKELVERTAKATDGFYRLGFDDLSVSFFKGELSLQGIRLAPDSAVFRAWKQSDSLPDTYVRAAIGKIGFKGLNLTWRWNFKQLDFYSFEVKDPQIEVFGTLSADSSLQVAKPARSKTLYELISPYIDVLSVGRLDLENADLTYSVEDSVAPMTYALRKATFHGYGFLLDSTSSESGKLLYLDHFDFHTAQPQTLLFNNDFRLTADSISLSTVDSVVYVGPVRIIPQEALWAGRRERPNPILEASVLTVEADGIAFERRKGRNYLRARSFEISEPRMRAFRRVSEGEDEAAADRNLKGKKVVPAARPDRFDGDSLVRALSLYELIAPVLRSISIGQVAIGNAKLQYAQALGDSVETYRLEHFDFTGDDFLIDSLSVEKQRFGYFRQIAFEASGIRAELTSRNHDLSVGRLALNTEKGYLQMEDLDLQPRSLRSRRDYLTARIDTARLDSLEYEKGVSVGLFRISSPEIRYVKAASRRAGRGKPSVAGDPVDVDAVLNPFFRYLTIRRIELQNASVSLTDRAEKGSPVYRLDHFNGYATRFRVDRETGRQDGLFFAYDDFGFDFRNFNNRLPGTPYRLAIRSGRLSTAAGNGRLEGVRLIGAGSDSFSGAGNGSGVGSQPLAKAGVPAGLNAGGKGRITTGVKVGGPSHAGKDNRKNDSLELSVPRVDIHGIRLGSAQPLRSWKVGVLRLEKPAIRMKEAGREAIRSAAARIEVKSLAYTPALFHIGEVNLIAPEVDMAFSAAAPAEAAGAKDTVGKVVITEPVLPGDKVAGALPPDTLLSAMVVAVQPASSSDTLSSGATIASASCVPSEPADSSRRPGSLASSALSVSSASVAPAARSASCGAREKAASDWYRTLEKYASRITLDKFHLEEGRLHYTWAASSPVLAVDNRSRLSLDLADLVISPKERTTDFGAFRFQGEDLLFPLNGGFYALKMARLTLDDERLQIDSIHLVSPYPKLEFAYYQPHHKDWFDVAARTVVVEGINRRRLLADSCLEARELRVDDILLQNYKNKQIPITPHIVPMLYTVIQQAPFKFSVHEAYIRRFNVIYEELAKKGTSLGRLVFTDMNGHVSGLTNIPSRFDQYIRLEATGNMMAEGPFHAVWQLPVDPANDRFLLQARLDSLDLTTLNQIITPLASAQVKSGKAYAIRFHMDAGSPGGTIDLAVPYRGLKVALLKKKDEGELADRSFLSGLANMLLKHDNPSYPERPDSQLREVHRYVERDPYHSTFNYLWQLLKPALIETVGVTRTEQKIAKGIGGFIAKIKNFFSFGKKKKTEELSSDTFILTEEELTPERK